EHTDDIAGMDEHGPVAGMLAPGAQARDELRNLGIVRTCMSEPAVRVLRRSLCPVVGDQALEALEARQPAPSAVDRADEGALGSPGGIEIGLLAGAARNARDDDVGAADRRFGIARQHRLELALTDELREGERRGLGAAENANFAQRKELAERVEIEPR